MALSENVSYVEDILQSADLITSESLDNNIEIDTTNSQEHKTFNADESLVKSSAVWTYNSTLILLRLYEKKLELLESPKKKTRIWIAISKSLRDYNIKMTPDQVRWKINALTKKYKQCLDNRQYIKFKYYREMDKIYAQYNVDCDTFNGLNDIMHRNTMYRSDAANGNYMKMNGESKAMTELRKVRLANRIECDITQSKINLEKQWLTYLKREEQNELYKDEVLDRSLKIREEEMELRQQELEMMESFELRKLQLKEQEQDEMLKIEREKCDLLMNLIVNKNIVY